MANRNPVIEKSLENLISMVEIDQDVAAHVVLLTLKGARILGKDKELAMLCQEFVKANPIPDPGVGAAGKH